MTNDRLSFNIIVAVDKNFGIGKDGGIPWHVKADMAHFKDMTTKTTSPNKKNAVIMGRKTWDSLPGKFKPLPGRMNVVLSRQQELSLPAGVKREGSLDEALRYLSGLPEGQIEGIFVIGGAQVYAQAVNHPQCRKIYVTEIPRDFHCDTFFPAKLEGFKKIFATTLVAEGKLSLVFSEYERI